MPSYNSLKGEHWNSGRNVERLVPKLFEEVALPLTEDNLGWSPKELLNIFEAELPNRYRSIKSKCPVEALSSVKGVLDHFYKVDVLLRLPGNPTLSVGLQVTTNLKKVDYKIAQLQEVWAVNQEVYIDQVHLLVISGLGSWEGLGLASQKQIHSIKEEIEFILLCLQEEGYNGPERFDLSFS